MFTHFKRFCQTRGFTLVEVLVVTSIIGALSGVILPSVNNARESARDDNRVAEVEQMQLPLKLLQQDSPLPDEPETICPTCTGPVNDAVRNAMGEVADPRYDSSGSDSTYSYVYRINDATNEAEICATQLERTGSEYCVSLAGSQVITYSWQPTGTYDSCSVTCGGGTQTENYECVDSDGTVVADGNCDGSAPEVTQDCNTQACVTYSWETSDWDTCSEPCGGGIQERTVVCASDSAGFNGRFYQGTSVSDSYCSVTKPSGSQPCNSEACAPTCVANEGDLCSDQRRVRCNYSGLLDGVTICAPDQGTFYDYTSYCPSTGYELIDATSDGYCAVQCDGTCGPAGGGGISPGTQVICENGFTAYSTNQCIRQLSFFGNPSCPNDLEDASGEGEWELTSASTQWKFEGFTLSPFRVCGYTYDD